MRIWERLGMLLVLSIFFSFDLIFLLLGEVIILGGEVFQAIFSKGFPPSRLYRPWGPTHTSYFFYFRRRVCYGEKFQEVSPFQAVAVLLANDFPILAQGNFSYIFEGL